MVDLSGRDEEVIRRLLNEWFPGTLISTDRSFVESTQVLVILYPEAEKEYRIPINGNTREIADLIVGSAERYRASLVYHEDLHTEAGSGNYDE